jgi:alpha-methylacyl-CoA racemase
VFATRTRDEWAEIFASTDACVTPVLTFAEATAHPHLIARGTLTTIDSVVQAAPAPRFSRTAPGRPTTPPAVGADVEAVYSHWGITDSRPPGSDRREPSD